MMRKRSLTAEDRADHAINALNSILPFLVGRLFLELLIEPIEHVEKLLPLFRREA